ncbi:hypothetical protein HA47_05430 [Pantoea stewartii subsp. indologenes]|nr:hypothetical protein HA47_05430 [Pantoea stewartii subsp. indologenes]
MPTRSARLSLLSPYAMPSDIITSILLATLRLACSLFLPGVSMLVTGAFYRLLSCRQAHAKTKRRSQMAAPFCLTFAENGGGAT